MPHPKWDERPLLLVVPKPGSHADAPRTSCAYYEGKVAKWWMPDAWNSSTSLPHDRDRQAVEGGPEAEVPGPLGGVAARSTILGKAPPDHRGTGAFA